MKEEKSFEEKKEKDCEIYVCLAVVGARLKDGLEKSFTFAEFKKHMDEHILRNGWDVKRIHFVSGGAKGIDSYAEKYCEMFGDSKRMIVLKPEWKDKSTGAYNRLAGLQRNTDIVEKCTHMIAFPDLKNGSGTQDSIRKCKNLGKPCHVVPLNGLIGGNN